MHRLIGALLILPRYPIYRSDSLALKTIYFSVGVPFKPLLKDTEVKECGVFNVSWDPPSSESGGGPVTRYQAQVQIEHESWSNCTTTPVKRSCLFKGLLKKGKYFVRVRALNLRGPSDWSKGYTLSDFSGMPSIFDQACNSQKLKRQ